MKKKIFLIGLFTLFSLTASEEPRGKRTAAQAGLPDEQLPPKKRRNRNDTVIIDRQEPPTNFAIALPQDLPLAAAQAAQHVTSQELPLPNQPYHCPQCKGKFEVSKEEHEEKCIVLKTTIACPNKPCKRTFIRQGDVIAHSRHCLYKK